MSNTSPPGWHLQPDGSQRYWDGTAWTAHHAARPAPYGAAAPQPWATQPFAVAPYAVAPKSPGLALLASFFIPGLGTLMNGETGKGIAILVGYFVAVLFSFILIGIPFALGLWIWGMVDAHGGAQKWNTQHGIRS